MFMTNIGLLKRKYVLQEKAADYLAYLNALVPELTYYNFIM